MKQFTLLFSILCGAFLLNAQTGKVMDKLVVKSKILNMDRSYGYIFPLIMKLQNVITLFYIYCMAGEMTKRVGYSLVK
jgi:hypothetical protein